MTGAPVNLNRARKAREREAAKREADENSVRFGRTKAQKTAERAEEQKAARLHDGRKREE